MVKYIVIEGTDGCGKQTQTELLANYLRSIGKNVIVQSFPNYQSDSAAPVKMYLGGDFGDANSLTAEQATVLFAVDRVCTYVLNKAKFENADYVIFDRYVQSNMLHQGGKLKDDNEKINYFKWDDSLEFDKLGLPRPSQIIFLDVPVEISKRLAEMRSSLKNGESKDVHEADKYHLENAYKTGKIASQILGWKTICCVGENGELKSREEIHQLIKNACGFSCENNIEM